MAFSGRDPCSDGPEGHGRPPDEAVPRLPQDLRALLLIKKSRNLEIIYKKKFLSSFLLRLFVKKKLSRL